MLNNYEKICSRTYFLWMTHSLSARPIFFFFLFVVFFFIILLLKLVKMLYALFMLFLLIKNLRVCTAHLKLLFIRLLTPGMQCATRWFLIIIGCLSIFSYIYFFQLLFVFIIFVSFQWDMENLVNKIKVDFIFVLLHCYCQLCLHFTIKPIHIFKWIYCTEWHTHNQNASQKRLRNNGKCFQNEEITFNLTI